jgi:hypothetical protein
MSNFWDLRKAKPEKMAFKTAHSDFWGLSQRILALF